MSMYSTEINMDGDLRKVVVINHEDDEKKVKSNVSVDVLHHIHILDRSGSMGTQINNLIDNVQKTIEVINDDDLISIIWFSSPGNIVLLSKEQRKLTA